MNRLVVMLAELFFRGRPRSLSLASAALALGLGLAGLGAAPAVSAETAAPVRLAVAVPITVPRTTDGLIPSQTLAQYTAPLGLLTRQLDAVIDKPVAIGVDPMIIASIRVLGSAAPPTASAWLSRLAAAGNLTFSLGYADADLTLMTQAGQAPAVQPESFDFAIDPTRFAKKNEVVPTPTPTTSPGAPPLPTTESLLELPFSLNGIAWPRDDTVVGSDLAALSGGGYTTTILSSTNLDHEPGDGAVATVGGTQVLVSDDSVSTAMRAAARSLTVEDWEAATGRLSTAIAEIARRGGSQATVFATLDRPILVSGNRLAETLDSLAANPGVTMVTMQDALAEAGSTATVVDRAHSPERIAQTSSVLAAYAAETDFATVTADPQSVLAPRRLALLALLSNAWDTPTAGWDTAVTTYLEDSQKLRGSVQLVKGNNFLLIADNDQFLPITVDNGLDQPVTVCVTVQPATGVLIVGNGSMELPIAPNSQGRVNVPVRSLSNGVVRVQISLSSGSGVSIGSPVSTRVNVQAGWETPVVVISAAVVLLIFAAGIVRIVLRRRTRADG